MYWTRCQTEVTKPETMRAIWGFRAPDQQLFTDRTRQFTQAKMGERRYAAALASADHAALARDDAEGTSRGTCPTKLLVAPARRPHPASPLVAGAVPGPRDTRSMALCRQASQLSRSSLSPAEAAAASRVPDFRCRSASSCSPRPACRPDASSDLQAAARSIASVSAMADRLRRSSTICFFDTLPGRSSGGPSIVRASHG